MRHLWAVEVRATAIAKCKSVGGYTHSTGINYHRISRTLRGSEILASRSSPEPNGCSASAADLGPTPRTGSVRSTVKLAWPDKLGPRAAAKSATLGPKLRRGALQRLVTSRSYYHTHAAARTVAKHGPILTAEEAAQTGASRFSGV